MEKELLNSDKEFLLKDLCARLPYGVKVQYQVGNQLPDIKTFNAKQYDELSKGSYIDDWLKCTFKPYLFPLSSMTEEQKKEYAHILVMSSNLAYSQLLGMTVYDWLNKNHFDYRGLIEKSLALDATGLNIY